MKTTVRNILFDLGGVFIVSDRSEAVRRFRELGVREAEELIDPYRHSGIFLDVEEGKLTAEAFAGEIGKLTGRPVTTEQVAWAWRGFIRQIPQELLDYAFLLRDHYRVLALSNTNPMMMDWMRTPAFTEAGRPITDYFETIYTSYELGLSKPDPAIFRYVIGDSGIVPAETLFVDDGPANIAAAEALGFQTFCPKNGVDWREPFSRILED